MLERDVSGFAVSPVVVPGGCDPGRAGPPPAGAVEKLRARLRLPADAVVLVLLARVAPVKGQAHALAAFARLAPRCPRAFLLLAYQRADGAYRRELEHAMRATGTRERVRWLGPQDGLGPLLGLADVGLVASVGSEGWSRAAVEYMHAGLPVVATRVGSLPEIVRPGCTGMLVPPAAAAEMAGALETLVRDERARRDMGHTARRLAAAEYTCERMSARVVEFYERIL